VSASSPSWP